MKTTADLKQINEVVYRLRLRYADQMQDVYFQQFNMEPPAKHEITRAIEQFEYLAVRALPWKSMEDEARKFSQEIEDNLIKPHRLESAAWFGFTEGAIYQKRTLARNARAFRSLVGA